MNLTRLLTIIAFIKVDFELKGYFVSFELFDLCL